MGTPEAMYDSDGNRTWSCDLDSYGRVRKFTGRLTDCPFRFQGQYEDEETGLYYNRFRYYSPEMGGYISQDPIRLNGSKFSLYAFVSNINFYVDILGLVGGGSYSDVRGSNIGGQVHHMPANSINDLSHGEGPSIWMETADHQLTASHGWQGAEGAAYRATQAELISQNQMAKAIEMDIDDIQGLFGSKYDSNIKEMIIYAESKEFISKDEAEWLKSKCK